MIRRPWWKRKLPIEPDMSGVRAAEASRRRAQSRWDWVNAERSAQSSAAAFARNVLQENGFADKGRSALEGH